MSTQTTDRRTQPEFSENVPIELIENRIAQTRRAVKIVDLATAFAMLLAGILGYLFVMALVDHWVVGFSSEMRLVALVVLLMGAAGFFVWRVLPPLLYPVNPVYAAHSIEQAAPTLKNSLINLLLLRQSPAGIRQSIFQGLERQTAGRLSHVPSEVLVDHGPLIRVGYVLLGLLAVTAAYKVLSPKDPLQTVARVVAPWKSIDRPSRVKIVELSPGDVEIYRGQIVEIETSLQGLRTDDEVVVHFSSDDGQFVDQPLVLERLDGLRFRGQLSTGATGIQQSLSYRLTAGDAQSPLHRVVVSDAPYISVQQVTYRYPRYTGLAERVTAGQGDLQALEGTQVLVEAEANVSMASAYVEFFPAADGSSTATEPSQILPMKVKGTRATASFTLLLSEDGKTPKAGSYQLRFSTPQGQRNAQPARYLIEVLPDLKPDVEILEPRAREIELPSNGRLEVEVRALDPDFAVAELVLQGTSAGRTRLQVSLLEQPEAGQVIRKHVLVPEKLGWQPNETVVFWAQASDNRQASAGELRPNVSRTPNYRIRILPPDPRSETSGDSGQQDGEPSGTEGDGQEGDAQEGTQGDGSGEADQPNSDETQQGDGEAAEGKQGEGKEGERGQGEGGQGEAQQGDSQQGERGQGDGSQGEGQQGASGQGNEPGENEGSEGQGGSKRRDGKASQQGPRDNTDRATGEDSGSGQQPASGAAGEQRDGAGSDETSGPRERQGRDNPSGRSGAQEAADEESGEPVPSDGSNDSDAFERILKHMRDNPEKAGEAGEAADQAGQQKPSRQQGDQAPEQNADRQSGKRSGEGAEGERRQPDATERGERPADGQSGTQAGDETDERQPGKQPQNASGKGREEGGDASPADRQQEQPRSGQSEQEPSERHKAAGDDGRGASAEQQPDAGQDGAEANQADRPGNSDSGSSDSGNSSDSGQTDSGQNPSQRRPESNRDSVSGAGASASDDDEGSGRSADQDGPRESSDEGTQDGQPSGRNADGASPDPSGGEPTRNGATGSAPSSGESSASENESAVTAEDEANLEYAQEATDLALEYLKNQPDDADLLERLGWTPEEARAFVDRWERMRRQATQPDVAGQQAKRRWQDQLQGLGLRPQEARVRSQQIQRDQLRDLRQSGGESTIPREYLDQYRAFLKSGMPPAERDQP